MSYSVSSIKSDLEGVLHGTTTSQITNLDGVLNRAARQLLLDVDPQETIRRTEITNPLMDNVYEYTLPSDVKGTKVIDIRPQMGRTSTDVFLHRYNQQFDLEKSYRDAFTIDFNTASKGLRVSVQGLSSGIQISSAISITGNGTWSADGVVATNLTDDNINSELKFDMSGGTAGYIQNLTLTAVDLSDHEDESTLLLEVYLPDASDFTSITLYWGSDSSNYWYASATTRQDGTAFQDGKNLVSFSWASATQALSPDSENVDFCKVLFTYNGTANAGVRVTNIVSNLGVIFEIEYYSKFLFRDYTTGAFAETIAADTDLINLDTESYNLFFYLVAQYAAQQQQGKDAKADNEFWETKYQIGLRKYRNQNKGQGQLPQSTYYEHRNSNLTRFIR